MKHNIMIKKVRKNVKGMHNGKNLKVTRKITRNEIGLNNSNNNNNNNGRK